MVRHITSHYVKCQLPLTLVLAAATCSFCSLQRMLPQNASVGYFTPMAGQQRRLSSNEFLDAAANFQSWFLDQVYNLEFPVHGGGCFGEGNSSSTTAGTGPCARDVAPEHSSAACRACLSALAASLGSTLFSDTAAMGDVCARLPKPPAVIDLFTRGTAWWLPVVMSLWGNRSSIHSQVQVQLWLGPVPRTYNDTYTVCGEMGSTTLGAGSHLPLLKGVGAVTARPLGGLQEAAATPIMGSTATPLLNVQDYWENKEFGQIDNTTGGPVGLIWPRAQLLLAYRSDWFEQLGLSPPATWDEMIQLAYALSALPGWHTTRYNPAAANDDRGPGLNISWPGHNAAAWPDVSSTPTESELLQEGPSLDSAALSKRWPLCLDLAPNCKGGDLLAAIAASMLQANGTAQNPYLDPATLVPHTTGAASAGWAAALRTYRDLALLASPSVLGLESLPFSSCAAVSRPFALGACAMAIEWDGAMPFLYAHPGTSEATGVGRPQDVPGNVGWAPLPGSSVVVDRETRTLTPCTPTFCPHAHRERVGSYVVQTTKLSDPPAGLSTSTGNSSSDHVVAYSQLNSTSLEAAGVTRTDKVERVNRAPFSAQAFTIYAQSCTEQVRETDDIVNAQTAFNAGVYPFFSLRELLSSALKGAYTAAKASGYFSSAYFAAPGATGQPAAGNASSGAAGHARKLRGLQQQTVGTTSLPLAKSIGGGPGNGNGDAHDDVDTPPVLPSLEPYLSSWQAPLFQGTNLSGVHPNDSLRLLAASWRARYQYTNQAPQIVLPIEVGPYFRTAYEEGLHYWCSVPGATVSSTLDGLTKRLSYLVSYSPASVRAVLCASTGYVAPAPSASEQQIQSGGTHSEVNLTAAIAAPIAVSVALVALLAAGALMYMQSSHNRTLQGAVRPPRGAPGTTIVLTDIQESTSIWETLPAEVMDEAVALHHATIRRLAAQHGGYESNTEGDSFLLAFHKASDATSFAANLQLELLAAAWPKELLDYELCSPVYAAHAMGLPPVRTVRTNNKPLVQGILSPLVNTARAGGEQDEMREQRGSGLGQALMSWVIRVVLRLRGQDLHAREGGGVSGQCQEAWVLYRPATVKRVVSELVEKSVRSATFLGSMAHNAGHEVARCQLGCEHVHPGGRAKRSWLQKLLRLRLDAPAQGNAQLQGAVSCSECEFVAKLERQDSGSTTTSILPPHSGKAVHGAARKGSSRAHVQIARDPDFVGSNPLPLSSLLNHKPVKAEAGMFQQASLNMSPSLPQDESPRPSCGTQPPVASVLHPMGSGHTAADLQATFSHAPSVPASPAAAVRRVLRANPSAPQLRTESDNEGTGHEAVDTGRGGGPRKGSVTFVMDGERASGGEAHSVRTVSLTTSQVTMDPGSLLNGKSPFASSGHPSTVGEQLALLSPLIPRASSAALQRRLSSGYAPSSTEGSAHNGLTHSFTKHSSRDVTEGAGKGERVVIFRGLRVRVGCASVFQELKVEASTNAAAGRTKYGGLCVAAARAVQDAAQGGMVLAAGSTFAQLCTEGMPPGVMVMHMGEHLLNTSSGSAQATTDEPRALYQIIPSTLLQRTPHLGPVRSLRAAGLGCLQAPCDRAAVCFLHAMGVGLLEAYDPSLAARSISVYQCTAQACLMAAGGYLLEAADGLVLAAFTRPACAIRWALDTIAACLRADWPEELLAHELGEAVALTLAATPRSVGQGAVMHEGVMGPGHVHQVEAGAAPAASQNSQAAGDAAGRCSPPSGPPSTAVGHPAAEGQMQVGAKGCPGAGDGAGHVPGSTAAGAAAAPKPGRKLGSRLSQLHVQQLLFRGLRLKCGIDYGPVRTDVVVATARIGMRGRVMNRAARVVGVAKSGQVVATRAAWDHAETDLYTGALEEGCGSREVVGTTLGLHNLKGLSEELELVQCLYPSPATVTNMVGSFSVGM